MDRIWEKIGEGEGFNQNLLNENFSIKKSIKMNGISFLMNEKNTLVQCGAPPVEQQ